MTQSEITENSASITDLIDEGHKKIDWAAPKAPLSFRFSWEKVIFTGKLSKIDDAHRLILLGEMGPLPFSAERPAYRDRLLSLIAWKTEERIRFVLEPQHQRVYLMIDDILSEELTGVALIASATASLFHAQPYMELAKEMGWQHPTQEVRPDLNVVSKDMTRSD